MTRPLLLSAVFCLGLSSALCAEEPVDNPPNKAAGLELPADSKAAPGDGFVTLAAKTTGEVRWLVVCPEKIKYLELDKTVIVSVPSTSTSIQVFAVALVEGKLTPFVRTVITVEGARPPPSPNPPPNPNPNPPPSPNPVPAGAKLHVTLVLDYDRLTPAQAALANSATLRKSLQDANCVLRVYPATSDVIKARRLDGFVTKAGGAPAIIIQDDGGVVRDAEKLPADEAGVLALVSRVRGAGASVGSDR